MPEGKPNAGGESGGNEEWEPKAKEAGWIPASELADRQSKAIAKVIARERARQDELVEKIAAHEAELEQLKAGKKGGEGKEGDLEQRLRQLEAKLDVSQKREAEMAGALNTARLSNIERDIVIAATKAGFQDPEDAVINLRGRISPDGKVLGLDGKPALDATTGEEMSIDAALAQIAKQKPHLLRDKTKQGMGFGGAGQGGGKQPIDEAIRAAQKAGDTNLVIKLEVAKAQGVKEI